MRFLAIAALLALPALASPNPGVSSNAPSSTSAATPTARSRAPSTTFSGATSSRATSAAPRAPSSTLGGTPSSRTSSAAPRGTSSARTSVRPTSTTGSSVRGSRTRAPVVALASARVGPQLPRNGSLPSTDPSLGLINTPNAATPFGPISQAVVSGNLLYISGTLPVSPATGQIVSPGNIVAQTHAVLANLKGIIEASGSSLGKVIRVSVYLKDIRDFDTMTAIYGEFFGAHKPARTAISVLALPMNAEVEMEAIVQM